MAEEKDAGTKGELESIQKFIEKLMGGFNWVALVSLAALVALLAIAIKLEWLPTDFTGDVLGFDKELVIIAALAGFLGSFVRVLNKAVSGFYETLSVLTMLLVALMRPSAGAMLGLFILAYNLGNFLSRLGLPKAIRDRSLRSLQVKLIKTGGRLVRHARRLMFQLGEVAVPRALFQGVLERIAALCPAPG